MSAICLNLLDGWFARSRPVPPARNAPDPQVTVSEPTDGRRPHQQPRSRNPEHSAGVVDATATTPCIGGRFRQSESTAAWPTDLCGRNETPGWLQIVLTQSLCFCDGPESSALPASPSYPPGRFAGFRYTDPFLDVAARLTHGSRQFRLVIDKIWQPTMHMAAVFHRLRQNFRRGGSATQSVDRGSCWHVFAAFAAACWFQD